MNSALLENIGIDLKGKVSGNIKSICPKCSHERKNKRDLCLSVDIDQGLYHCHHCGWKGKVFERVKKEYVPPVPRLEKLSKKSLEFFESRGISNNTLLRFNVTEAREWMHDFGREVPVICFNYYRAGELVNIKFRGPKKSFKMAKDAELIFYNLDALQDENTAVIVEGEIDCLTFHECGIYNVVSVPNGATKGNQKLEYLDNCWGVFEGIEKVILAVDSDEAGRLLREELARRIGKEKCYTVEYGEGCKDANEVLLKYGRQAVAMLIENAREWPIEGVKTMDDIYPTVSDWFEHGYPKGAATGIEGFDRLLTFAPGQLTVVTGIPGHGKDEFMNWVMTSLSKNHYWPWAVCGFEETPEETTTKLIEKFAGKSFAHRVNPYDRVTVTQYEAGIGFVDRYFSFINTEDIDTDIDGILNIAELLVKKKGIKGLYINPWNWIEHKRHMGQSETEYVSDVLSKIIRFAKKRGVHVFLLAHTTKMQKDKNTKKYEVPTLYSISGSAHFYNKTHNGITIYRDFETGMVDVYVQKVKQSWLGQTGFSSYTYNTLTRQYQFVSSSVTNWKPIDN
jgi:twinkle protein